jgi:uncharacterized protein (TIGR03083 family)
MPSDIPKDRTIEALREEWASIDDLLSQLSHDEWSKPSPLPGWNVKDNVAHIIGTEEMLSGVATPDVALDPEHLDYIQNDIGHVNEAWVISMRQSPPDAVIDRFRQVTGDRLEALEAMSDEEWHAEGFTPAGKDSYGRFMRIRVFDCWLHEQDMRDAVGRPGNHTGLPVEVTLDEMTSAMGFVVGKQAGAPAGSRVTFALTDDGAVVRTIHVEVGERAEVVEELSGPATVTLTMPVGVMTRRCAGRVGPAALRDQITVEGDEVLADRILANQAYTI